ncbi:hypothetical protein RND81_01G102500 [Saponaria officinalis]|uniref:Peptidase A1 domain-containing protein n=1 Tax=Saponaria officinalis TaxID=3572 RepID=A0AAW1NEC8_SAPOF
MKQKRSLFDGKFSYCLQSMYFEVENSPMYLRFGNDVLPQQIKGMHSTPMYIYEDTSLYYLNLQGITVGASRLDIHPYTFQRKPDKSGGCSSLSYIVSEAYKIFEDAMKKPKMDYKLCYERYRNPARIILPVITLHFEDDYYVINDTESFYKGTTSTGNDMVCLQFFESTYEEDNNLTVLGMVHQTNKRIMYDTRNSLLHFATTNCALEN